MRNTLIAVAVLVLLGLGIAVGIKVRAKAGEGEGGRRGGGGAAVPVEIAPVRPATMKDVGHFTGSLLPDSRFILAPRVGGRLEKLLVNIGDPVHRGQLIAELDDQEFVQQLERAKADLVVARATLAESISNRDNAQREFARAKALLDKKVASESEYDQAKAVLEVQEARVRVATAQVDQKDAARKEAEIRLSYTRIQATWEGGAEVRTVGERFVDEGALLAANTPIVSVLDVSTLKAVIYVIERDYTKIAVGQSAAITTDAWPDRVFEGKIARIAPQLMETSRQARVEIAVSNTDGALKPGMFVRVALEYSEHDGVNTIPVAALVRRGGRRGVFVATDGKARFVAVEPGITNDERVELLGPALGGPVVVMGQHLLEDGAAIRIVKPASEPETPPDLPPSPSGSK